MTETTLPLASPLPSILQEAIEKFDRWSQAHLLEEQAKTVIEGPLYQYTNEAGIKGILESQEMWFSDYRHLNDPSELHHGMDMAHDMLRDAQSGGVDGRVRLFLKCAADLFSRENLDETLEFFVASFTPARDDLGQWRAYGDNGRGFAIGFAPRMFAIREELSPAPEENTFLGPVLYDVPEVLGRNRLAIDKAAEIFFETVNAQAALVADKTVGFPFMRELALHLIASPLIWNALTSKHPAYTHEQEVRLLIMGTCDKLKPVIRTRTRGVENVPYIGHPWAVREPGAIAEIIVGPAAPDGAEEALRALLATYGVADVEVGRSDIPYRAL